MELPTRLEKTSLKEYAQLDERFQARSRGCETTPHD